MKNAVSKKGFEILDHKADLKIHAYGKNLEKLLNNILEAILEGTNPVLSEKEIKTKVKIFSKNLESLIIDFLSELIYQMDINDSVYTKIKTKKLTEKEIEGELFGKKVRRFTTEIKGVTWHDFEIKKEGDSFSATILFDV